MHSRYSQDNNFHQQLVLDTGTAVLTTISKCIATRQKSFRSLSENHNGSNNCFKKETYLLKLRRIQFRQTCRNFTGQKVE